MKKFMPLGTTSNILRVFIQDYTSSQGAGLTSLAYNTSGLVIATIAENESSATVYRVADNNIETITTLGTFAAPTSNKCRFKEIDAINLPGWYEIQIADARFNVANARSLGIHIFGAASLVACSVEIIFRAEDATAAAIADAVWDEQLADHISAGSTGEKLDQGGGGGGGGGGVADWTTNEKAQIRYALGITGTKTATSGGVLDTIGSQATNILNRVTDLPLVADIWSYASRTLTAFSTTLALAVWDVLLSASVVASSFGERLKNLALQVTLTGIGNDVGAIPTVQEIDDYLTTQHGDGSWNSQLVCLTYVDAVTSSLTKIYLVKGDTPRMTFKFSGDWTNWTPKFAAKIRATDTSYAIAAVTGSWTNASLGEGYFDLAATDLATAGEFVCEIQMSNGTSRRTVFQGKLYILEDIIDG